MSELVTVVSCGEKYTHFPHWDGNYATLCCLDGDDENKQVDQKVVSTPRNARVNCRQCANIYNLISEYSEIDITPSLRRNK